MSARKQKRIFQTKSKRFTNVCFFLYVSVLCCRTPKFVRLMFVERVSVFSPVFRVDLFCSGKVDGEAVVTVQLNLTIHANNYTVLNFKRRKMCYKSKRPNNSYPACLWGPEMEKVLIFPCLWTSKYSPNFTSTQTVHIATTWRHAPWSEMDSCFKERLCDEIQHFPHLYGGDSQNDVELLDLLLRSC